MKTLSQILLTAAFLTSMPASARAQPNVLLPNELHWFTHGTRPEAVDRKRLGELLMLDAKLAANQPWLVELLAVGWTGFADADMKDVVRMKKLTHLWIRKPNSPDRGDFKLTAAGWSELRRLQGLRVLGISDCELDDDSFAEIGKLSELTTIYLHCKGSDAGVKKLMNLKKLVHVSINVQGAKPGDDIARDIAKMTELKDLGIGHATISDDGVKALAKLPKLRSLGISSAKVTDAGLMKVAGMKSMVAVNFASNKVTQDGIDELWKARPDLLMINSAGMPPGPDSLWTMQIDFFGPYGEMVGPRDEKTLTALTDGNPALRRLSIGWPGMSGAVMKDVVQFKRLTHLYVLPAEPKVKLDAKDWKRLSELPRLQMLAVNGVPLDAESFAEIGKLKELRTLRLIHIKGGDAAVRHVGNLKKLTGLELLGTQLTDAGLKELAPFENLHFLSLAGNHITDDGLKHLASFPSLGHVNLDTNKITDAGLRHLGQIKRLYFVSLGGAAMSDEGLKTLAQIKTLKAVNNLPMDRVTQKGLEWFAKARPDIQYLPPPGPIELGIPE